MKVLFVCVHNSGRSQMAEAFTRVLSGGAVVARSAGTLPGSTLNPVVAQAMEGGAGHTPYGAVSESDRSADGERGGLRVHDGMRHRRSVPRRVRPERGLGTGRPCGTAHRSGAVHPRRGRGKSPGAARRHGRHASWVASVRCLCALCAAASRRLRCRRAAAAAVARISRISLIRLDREALRVLGFPAGSAPGLS